MDSLRIVQQRDRIVIVHNERYWFEIPYQTAKELVTALQGKIKDCEEWEQRERVIRDQAILLKTSHPFALTNKYDMLAEAVELAKKDDKLRRYIGSHVSPVLIGTPTISVVDKEEKNAT